MSKSTKIRAVKLSISLGVCFRLLKIYQLGCATALRGLAESNPCSGLFSRALGLQLSNLSAEALKQLHRQRACPCLQCSFLGRGSTAYLPDWFLLFLFWTFLYRDKWRDGAAAWVFGGVLVIPGTVTNWTRRCWVPVLLSHYWGPAFPLLFHKLFSKPSVILIPPSQKGANSLTQVLPLSASSIHKHAWLQL